MQPLTPYVLSKGVGFNVDSAMHLAIMVYSEKLLNIIALTKCEDYHTKKLIYMFCIIIAYTKTRATTQVLMGRF